MHKYRVIIEVINSPESSPIFDPTPTERAEFVINGEARIDEMIEKYIRLLGVMGWVPENYLEKLEEYFDSVEK